MKKIVSIIIIMLAVSSSILAQDVPMGMKYQAVARDAKGIVLANSNITLRINLNGNNNGSVKTYYSELHNIVTNEMGLFTLVIGDGKAQRTKFSEVPWSTNDIWMEIAISEKSNGNFTVISNSKLLSVPYAFHAGTASKILTSMINAKGGDPASTSGNSWNVGGNLATNPPTDYLGTADAKDFIIKTNGIQRIFISADGATSFSGKLIVDDLTQSTAYTNGALVVKGGAGIAKNLNVGENFGVLGNVAVNTDKFNITALNGNTGIAGTLDVAGNFAINTNKFNVTAANGNTGIAGDVVVGVSKFNITAANGNTSIAGNVAVNTNKFTITALNGNTGIGGTLDVLGNLAVNTNKFNIAALTGNTGIGGTLDVLGNLAVNTNKFNIAALTGNTGIGGTLDVLGNLAVNTNKFNIAALTGNTGIGGTLGVQGITTLNNSVFANGQVKISVLLPNFADNDYANYPLQVEGSKQGIAIKLNSSPYSNPTEQNNFVSFLNSNGEFRGRIEGHPSLVGSLENVAQDIVDNLTLSFTDAFALPNATSSDAQEPANASQIFTSNAAIEGYERTLDFLTSVFRFATNVVGAAGVCLSGDCDDVIWSAVDMGVDLGKLGVFIWLDNEQAGVSYESGGADYAEWMPKFYPDEKFSYGDVVGVRGGIISKTFKEADKFMIISFAPAVIGGMPEITKEDAYEKIAFMGQVMTKVMGVVNKGDYILPAGNGDGYAIAVAPDKMKALDYQRVIGVSWGESDGKEIFKYIKTAVGINTNDMAGMIDNMQSVMNKMQEAIKKLSPEYVPSYFSASNSFAQIKSGYSTMPAINEQMKTKVGGMEKGEAFATKLKEVKATLMEQGIDLSKYKMIENCINNPTKENAELLAARANLVLAQYQAIFAAAQKQKSSK